MAAALSSRPPGFPRRSSTAPLDRIKLPAQRVPGLDQIQVRISGKLVETEVADLSLSVEARPKWACRLRAFKI